MNREFLLGTVLKATKSRITNVWAATPNSRRVPVKTTWPGPYGRAETRYKILIFEFIEDSGPVPQGYYLPRFSA